MKFQSSLFRMGLSRAMDGFPRGKPGLLSVTMETYLVAWLVSTGSCRQAGPLIGGSLCYGSWLFRGLVFSLITFRGGLYVLDKDLKF